VVWEVDACEGVGAEVIGAVGWACNVSNQSMKLPTQDGEKIVCLDGEIWGFWNWGIEG
jgi:hypothetical protein